MIVMNTIINNSLMIVSITMRCRALDAAGGPACADVFIPWYSQCSGEFARMDLQAEILKGKKTDFLAKKRTIAKIGSGQNILVGNTLKEKRYFLADLSTMFTRCDGGGH